MSTDDATLQIKRENEQLKQQIADNDTQKLNDVIQKQKQQLGGIEGEITQLQQKFIDKSDQYNDVSEQLEEANQQLLEK